MPLQNPESLPTDAVRVRYCNHANQTRFRIVRVIDMWFGSTQWHPRPQWLLKVWDYEKQAERDYAMSGVTEWQPLVALSEERLKELAKACDPPVVVAKPVTPKKVVVDLIDRMTAEDWKHHYQELEERL